MVEISPFSSRPPDIVATMPRYSLSPHEYSSIFIPSQYFEKNIRRVSKLYGCLIIFADALHRHILVNSCRRWWVFISASAACCQEMILFRFKYHRLRLRFLIVDATIYFAYDGAAIGILTSCYRCTHFAARASYQTMLFSLIIIT